MPPAHKKTAFACARLPDRLFSHERAFSCASINLNGKTSRSEEQQPVPSQAVSDGPKTVPVQINKFSSLIGAALHPCNARPRNEAKNRFLVGATTEALARIVHTDKHLSRARWAASLPHSVQTRTIPTT